MDIRGPSDSATSTAGAALERLVCRALHRDGSGDDGGRLYVARKGSPEYDDIGWCGIPATGHAQNFLRYLPRFPNANAFQDA